MRLPFRNRHLNLKKRFSEQLGETTRYGMAGALRRVGLRLFGMFIILPVFALWAR